MRLLEDDETYLNDKGHTWQLFPEGAGACLVISDYPVSPAVYNCEKTDLMIRIPAQYNIAGLDMFYVSPEIRLKATGSYPAAAAHFEGHIGRRWQRFSRHLITTRWRAGVDSLRMFMSLIQKELQARG